MELADDSDNYSEDFYSDEDRKQGEDEFEDRSDDSFDQQETVKQANLNEVVNIYQKYLGPGEQHQDDSGKFLDYQFSDSFKD